ncbi:MAG: glycosyltransferase family 2 protein [Alphaproteobacteria bacterium]
MINLSVLIIVHNEEKQLKDCLDTVSFADELVIVLDKCSDRSKQISKKFTKKIYSGSWDIEGRRRNFGLKKCHGKWILEIDADERVSIKMKNEIIQTIKQSNSDWHLINVDNFFGNRLIRYGWGAYIGKSSYAGLFKKNTKKWGNQRVHPKIVLKGKQGPSLKNNLKHFYCKSVSDLFCKLDSYSSARAKDLNEMNSSETLFRNVRRIFSRFWKSFILRKGFKEKRIGFLIATVAGLYPLISFLKYKIEIKK